MSASASSLLLCPTLDIKEQYIVLFFENNILLSFVNNEVLNVAFEPVKKGTLHSCLCFLQFLPV